MENNKKDVNSRKLSYSLKNKLMKGYQNIMNKTNINYNIPQIKKYNNFCQVFDKSSSNLNDESYNSFQINQKHSKTNYIPLKNLKIQHLSREKKDDYNNILNKLFHTTSNLIKHKTKKLENAMLINSYYNMNLNEDDANRKNKILNKLFPNTEELSKYSDVPFFSLTKRRTPFKTKVNVGIINKKYKIKQEEFLFKISNGDFSNKLNNFNINKGIKKGVTSQYFHGVDKFCINNKISETNFPSKETIKKKKLNFKLNIENVTKGEKTLQMSNREKKLKMLEKNVKNIKSIPNDLINGLEYEVFKLLDEEFDKNYNTKTEENEKKEDKKNLDSEINRNENKKDESNQINVSKSNINNYNIELIPNNTINSRNNFDNSYINPNTMKRPKKYPVNFYTTQQVRKKEHFTVNSKITFEERVKMLQKREKKEKEEKDEKHLIKSFKNRLHLENLKDLKLKKIMNNREAYKKQCKIRDILIGNKLKNTYDEIDSKRILNGLKPWVYINADEKKKIDLDKLKQKFNEDIKNIL